MLAFGTVSVTTGIEGNLLNTTFRANLGMGTKSRGSAMSNHMKGFGLSWREALKANMFKNILKLRQRNHPHQEGFSQRKDGLLIGGYS